VDPSALKAAAALLRQASDVLCTQDAGDQALEQGKRLERQRAADAAAALRRQRELGIVYQDMGMRVAEGDGEGAEEHKGGEEGEVEVEVLEEVGARSGPAQSIVAWCVQQGVLSAEEEDSPAARVCAGFAVSQVHALLELVASCIQDDTDPLSEEFTDIMKVTLRTPHLRTCSPLP
jgi:hypothetical protein